MLYVCVHKLHGSVTEWTTCMGTFQLGSWQTAGMQLLFGWTGGKQKASGEAFSSDVTQYAYGHVTYGQYALHMTL